MKTFFNPLTLQKADSLALVSIIFLGCAAPYQDGKAAQEAPAPASQPASDPADLEVIATANRIEKQVEEMRGLKFKYPVKKGIYDKERLAKFLDTMSKKEGIETQMAWQEKAMKMLGLIPDSMDVLQETKDLLLEQIGGFYDPESRELRVMRGFTGFVGDILMAHELCHALEDQYFGLKEIDEANKAAAPDNDDRQFAAHAVMEGSATDLMNRFTMAGISTGKVKMEELKDVGANPALSGERAMKAPPILVRPLMEMYLSGATFLARGKGMAGVVQTDPEDVENAFWNPPLSSEQVLHPAKYWNKKKLDLPQAVTLPELAETLGSGWKKLGSNVMGELGVAILTMPPEPEEPETQGKEDSMKAAMKLLTAKKFTEESSGWDGDRYAIYQNGAGDAILAWVVTFDRDTDAKEFETWLQANLTPSPVRPKVAVKIANDVDVVVCIARGAAASAPAVDLGAIVAKLAKDTKKEEEKPLVRNREK